MDRLVQLNFKNALDTSAKLELALKEARRELREAQSLLPDLKEHHDELMHRAVSVRQTFTAQKARARYLRARILTLTREHEASRVRVEHFQAQFSKQHNIEVISAKIQAYQEQLASLQSQARQVYADLKPE